MNYDDILCDTSYNTDNSSDEEECITQDDITVQIYFPSEPLPPFSEKKQFLELKKIKYIEQRTKEWFDLRKKMITASDVYKAMGNGNYLIKKKCGEGAPFKAVPATIWGNKYEPIAIKFYEYYNNVKVHEFGVIQHPLHSFIGASPDGIVSSGIMLEIKCVWSRKITGIIKPEYFHQIQIQMEVCNLSYCDFLECKMVEYNSLEHYLDDTKNHDEKVLKTVDNSVKGCIITYIDINNNYVYFYSELGINEQQFYDWKLDVKTKTMNKNLRYKEDTFWRIDKMSCVRVSRDQKWFNNILPKLRNVWFRIEERRKEIGYYSDKKMNKKKEDIKEIVEEYTMLSIKEAIAINTLSDCKNRIYSFIPIFDIKDGD